MKINKIIACLLCLSFVLGTFGATIVSALSACEVSSMTAVYNTQTETVKCTVKYSGVFLPNQSYVFILSTANGSQISQRTVNGTQLGATGNSFGYNFHVSTSLVSSAAKPLRVTVRCTQPSVISTYTTDVVVIEKNPTVSFVGKDGTVLNTQTVDYGTAATAPEAPKIDGFDFVGWDKDFSVVTSDMTVTAEYRTLQYSLTVIDGTGSGIYTYGTEVDIVFAPDTDNLWEFDGWETAGNAVIADPASENTTVTVYGDAVITPCYTEVFIVSITGGKVAESDVKAYYKAGDVIEIIADAPAVGKEFAGWETVSGGVITDASACTTTLTINNNVIIEAIYTDSRYTFDVVGGDGSGTYTYGQEVEIRFSTEDGAYRFDGWTVDGDAIIADPASESTTVTVYGNATVTGSFTRLYSVNILNGTVHTDDIKDYYQAGDVLRIIADSPEEGMMFDTWAVEEGDCLIADASAESTTITVGDMDLVVCAQYVQKPEDSSSEEELYCRDCPDEDLPVSYDNHHDSIDMRWTMSCLNADYIEVSFSPNMRISSDDSYFIRIYNGSDVLQCEYTVAQLAGETITVYDDTVEIRLCIFSPERYRFEVASAKAYFYSQQDYNSSLWSVCLEDYSESETDSEEPEPEPEPDPYYSYCPVEYLPESDHNYSNNTDKTWVLQCIGASSIEITFSSDTKTENFYDKIYIYNGDNTLVGTYAGSDLAGRSVTVHDDTVQIHLKADETNNDYGFKVISATACRYSHEYYDSFYWVPGKGIQDESAPDSSEESSEETTEEPSSEETTEEPSSGEDSSDEEEIYACTVSDMTVIYNNMSQTIVYKIEYTGTFIPNQAYMFVLSNGNGGMISSPTVMGSELTLNGNTIIYSYHLSASALPDAQTPVTGTIRCGVPQIISPYTAELSYKVGDVNSDGEVDNLDAAYILRYDVELISFDAYQLLIGDVNGDGVVDSLDAAQILKYDAGLASLY
ncbi:MAG: InlB B-repeat-containing protein [Clostridia bacterium]|nr:InlB B-repeat-containing protein [Clostridia bacterium]